VITTVVLAACYGTVATPPIDADGDGVPEQFDCDDTKAAVSPKGREVCSDKLDNDCNGLVDAADPACKPPTASPAPEPRADDSIKDKPEGEGKPAAP